MHKSSNGQKILPSTRSKFNFAWCLAPLRNSQRREFCHAYTTESLTFHRELLVPLVVPHLDLPLTKAQRASLCSATCCWGPPRLHGRWKQTMPTTQPTRWVSKSTICGRMSLKKKIKKNNELIHETTSRL